MLFGRRRHENKSVPRANLGFSAPTTLAHRDTSSLCWYGGSTPLVPSLPVLMKQSDFPIMQHGSTREPEIRMFPRRAQT